MTDRDIRTPANVPVRFATLATVIVLVVAEPVCAVGPNNALNDTGINLFGDNSGNNLTSEPSTHPRQDASQGRDAAAKAGTLVKVGGGSKGFDFTKIANIGSALPPNAKLGYGPTDWGCTQDNVTGLTWEVKVNDATHLRHLGWTYTWYNSNVSVNGGDAGTLSGGTCKTAGRCDIEKFVADINAAGLCGHSDWRMPTGKELHTLVDLAIAYPGPTVDTAYVPNIGSAASF